MTHGISECIHSQFITGCGEDKVIQGRWNNKNTKVVNGGHSIGLASQGIRETLNKGFQAFGEVASPYIRAAPCTPFLNLCLSAVVIGHQLRIGVAASPSCDEGYYQCRSGKCIENRLHCDIRPDCPDGDDENDEVCDLKICGKGQFHCGGNECIPDEWVCDGFQDCNAGEDEYAMHCDIVCSVDQFKCRSGECIKQDWLCDGVVNCHDSHESDELMHHCKIIADKYNCSEYNDNVNKPSTSGNQTSDCDPSLFRCSNGQCIPYHLVDVSSGSSRCDDGSDQNKEYTRNEYSRARKAHVCGLFSTDSSNNSTDTPLITQTSLNSAIGTTSSGTNPAIPPAPAYDEPVFTVGGEKPIDDMTPETATSGGGEYPLLSSVIIQLFLRLRYICQ